MSSIQRPRNLSSNCYRASASQTSQTKQWRNGTKVSLPDLRERQNQRLVGRVLRMSHECQPTTPEMGRPQTRRQARSSTSRIPCTANLDQDRRSCVTYRRSKLERVTKGRYQGLGIYSIHSVDGVVFHQSGTMTTVFQTRTQLLSLPSHLRPNGILCTSALTHHGEKALYLLQTPTQITTNRLRDDVRQSFAIVDRMTPLFRQGSTFLQPIMSNTVPRLNISRVTGKM